MKFTGRQLKDMGVPQSRIKFLVGVEFDSEQAVLDQMVQTKHEKAPAITVFDLIASTFAHLPMTLNGNRPATMSRSELRRVMDSGGIQINNTTPSADTSIDAITFPITTFVWFPSSKRRVTWR